MQLKIQYYALMREQAGRSEETLETGAGTPADLYGELTARYGFTLTRDQLKGAVNSEFSDWSRRLAAGDAVVFIPPLAGGSCAFGLLKRPSTPRRRDASCSIRRRAATPASRAGCGITTRGKRSLPWNMRASRNSPSREASASSPKPCGASR